jgi:membrane-associated phospholipid phosphatase
MYTNVKTTFSANGFPYDKLVADIDKGLHFGHAPSYWLAFLRGDWLLRIVETNYDLIWFPLWLATLYWFCTSPHAERLRVRFVLTFMMVWVMIGNVVAGLALTAGPALYGDVTGDHQRFAKLEQFLDSTPNSTSATQHYLWTLHEAGTGGLGSGISAFPSVHVAVTVCCALFIAEMDKRLGVLAWAYVAIIMMSSVYLGWHYAVDGYASVILTTAFYWALRGIPALRKLRFSFRRPDMIAIGAGADTAAP